MSPNARAFDTGIVHQAQPQQYTAPNANNLPEKARIVRYRAYRETTLSKNSPEMFGAIKVDWISATCCGQWRNTFGSNEVKSRNYAGGRYDDDDLPSRASPHFSSRRRTQAPHWDKRSFRRSHQFRLQQESATLKLFHVTKSFNLFGDIQCVCAYSSSVHSRRRQFSWFFLTKQECDIIVNIAVDEEMKFWSINFNARSGSLTTAIHFSSDSHSDKASNDHW